jgi:hypothetical protein
VSQTEPQKDTQRDLDTKPTNAVNDAELSNFVDPLGTIADSWSRPEKLSQGRLLGRYFAAK